LKLSEGLTDQEIKDYFAVQYGDRVLSEPPRRGLNWLVYVLPVAAFVVGMGIVLGVIVSMRRAPKTRFSGDARDVPPTPTAPGAAQRDPYLARVEEELKKQEDR
jgi:cytochrome c-type biogenesis protein CcmH